jgi:hypothetical protein
MQDVFLQQCGFIFYLHIHGIDQHDGIFFACIKTATEDAEGGQIGCGDTQSLEDCILKFVCRMGEWESDFGETEHATILPDENYAILEASIKR